MQIMKQELENLLVKQTLYENETFILTGVDDITIPLKEIVNPIITLRRNMSFSYNGRNYMIKLDSNAASFLRVAQEKY